MKILIINDRLDMAGGAERYTVDVAYGLASRGHEVAVIYGCGEYQISNINPFDKLRIDTEQSRSIKYQSDRANFKDIFVKDLDSDGVLGEIYSFRPDVVYVQNISEPFLLAELAKSAPTVKFVHDHRVYCPGNSKMWLASGKICPIATSWRCAWYAYRERCLTRRPKRLVENIIQRQKMLAVLQQLPKVLCNSRYVRERLRQNGLMAEKVEVNPLFPGGLEPSGLHYNTLEYCTGTSVGCPEILFVGRVFVEKGVEYLLRAAAMIKDAPFRVVVVGEGWDLERVKKLSSDLAIKEKVEFTGFLPRAEIDKYYARCRILVLPSLWPEPFGMVGLEALSFGKPVVAFNVGGITDWLKDGEVGFLVERGDIEQLAVRIKQLLQDEPLAKKMGEAGRQLVQEKFTLERHLHRLLRTFREVSPGLLRK